MPSDASQLIDTARYPIADLGSPAGQAFVDSCRAALERDGAVVLRDLVNDAALAAMAREARACTPQAFFCDNSHNVYLTPDDDRLNPRDPRRRRLHTVVGSIAYDLGAL